MNKVILLLWRILDKECHPRGIRFKRHLPGKFVALCNEPMSLRTEPFLVLPTRSTVLAIGCGWWGSVLPDLVAHVLSHCRFRR